MALWIREDFLVPFRCAGQNELSMLAFQERKKQDEALTLEDTTMSIAKCIAVSAFIALSLSAGAATQTIEAQVLAVQSGDTLTVLVEGRQIRVSLAEIDAPELRQAFGPQSRQSLTDLCLRQPAVIEVASKNRDGRVAGKVKCNGIDANAAQVERGMAWVTGQRPKSASPLYFLQDQAQRSRLGLWADPAPLEPWRWRRSPH